jgi:hypothetical protein
MEIYLATKKNEILTFVSKWMEEQNIILSKVCQAQKAKYSIFSFVCRLQTQNKNSNIIRHGSHTRENMHGRNREMEGNLQF